MARGEAAAAAARACVGARFRAHGRDPAWGLDCVGVAAHALGREVAGDYPMRGGDRAAIVAAIERAGLRRARRIAAGDLLLIDEGAGQLHLAIATDGAGAGAGFVHACARLRRVVETPGRPAGLVGNWREA